MTTAKYEPTSTLVMKAIEAADLYESELRQTAQSELVRGEDASLLARIEPLVRLRSVTLDLGGVERIDAAGITALVSLYRSARDAGHCFHVTNVPRRVARILKMVGLDRLLLSHNAVDGSQYDPCSQRSAA
jgi:anti-anti-sigma factor